MAALEVCFGCFYWIPPRWRAIWKR